MRQYTYFLAVGVLFVFTIAADKLVGGVGPVGGMHEIQGQATKNLQPIILVSRDQLDWSFGINFTGPTNIPKDAWLKITNRVGSKLELSQSDGRKLPVKDPDAQAALRLPVQTTVANAVEGINRRWRSGQWLRFPTHEGKNGRKIIVPTAAFGLGRVYALSFTNNLILKITPLLYKAESNDMVRLIEFPPITLNLMTNGDVQKVTPQ